MKTPSYTNPDEKFGAEYFAELKRYNAELKAQIGAHLREHLHDLEQIAICTPGSDGREEKSPGPSRAELMIVASNRYVSDNGLAQTLRKIAHQDPDVFHSDVELKILDKTLMNCYADDRARIFPTRVADSAFLCGNEILHQQAKLRLAEEWLCEDGSYIVDRSSSKRKEARKVLRDNGKQTYRQKNVQHYDLTNRWADFDPENFVLSFKAGPLRAVQTGIMHSFIKHCREADAGKTRPYRSFDLITHLPRNTEERILFLSQLGLICAKSAKTLAQAYNDFLYQYHRSEHAFNTAKEKRIQIPDLREQEKDICAILDTVK